MGQYYCVLVEDKDGHPIRVSPNEYNSGLKLTEHSWWENYFVNRIVAYLLNNPKRVAWVGDYSYEEPVSIKYNLHSLAYNTKFSILEVGEKEIFKEKKTLDGFYLVNHTKEIYLDCDKYKTRSNKNEWIIHPLPLLTAVGNGLGGGDYHGINEEDVGSWCYDTISVQKIIQLTKKKRPILVSFLFLLKKRHRLISCVFFF